MLTGLKNSVLLLMKHLRWFNLEYVYGHMLGRRYHMAGKLQLIHSLKKLLGHLHLKGSHLEEWEVVAYLEVLEGNLGSGKLFLVYVRLHQSCPISSLQFIPVWFLTSHDRNQSDFISRDSGAKRSASVLALGQHEGLGKSRDEGISSWGWNLSGQHSSYHALFPRAWTIYDGRW